MVSVLGPEPRSTPRALALRFEHPAAPSAVRIQRRRAIRANDPQILEAIIVAHAVYVIEDQRHPAALPDLVLAAQFARRQPETFLVETLLQRVPGIPGVLNEDLFQRLPAPASPETLKRCGVGIEVVSADAPLGGPLADRLWIASRRAGAHVPQRLRPGSGDSYGPPEILLRKRRSGRALFIGGEVCNVDPPGSRPFAERREVLSPRRDAKEPERIRPRPRADNRLLCLFLRVAGLPGKEAGESGFEPESRTSKGWRLTVRPLPIGARHRDLGLMPSPDPTVPDDGQDDSAYPFGPRTLPPLAPASIAGPRGEAMPSTRIALRPRLSFSRPLLDTMSWPQSSRTRSSR